LSIDEMPNKYRVLKVVDLIPAKKPFEPALLHLSPPFPVKSVLTSFEV